MSKSISIIIRNKNEAENLEQLLKILTEYYSQDFEELILVDNKSTDNSIAIANKYNCKVIIIEKFSYGRACNLGIQNAKNEYCIFLSSHSIPFGKDFFKNIPVHFKKDKKIAGLRFCKNLREVRSYYENKNSKDDLNAYGLMNSASAIRKSSWEKVKFDENVNTSEDKIWTRDIAELGYYVALLPNVFFYINTRDSKSEIKRYKRHKMAMMLNPDIYQHKKKISSGFYFLREVYRAGVIFLRRIRFLLGKLWVDITIRK